MARFDRHELQRVAPLDGGPTSQRPARSRPCLALLLVITATASAPALAQRVAFTTSVSGSGNLGSWPDAGGQTGLAAGDMICQARAVAGGLANPQSFVAWLSDESNDAYCRLHGLTGTRAANCGQPSLPAAAGPWVRTDGMPFAGSIADLAGNNGVVLMPLRLDELGNELPLGSGAFTATLPEGSFYFPQTSCGSWTSAAGGDFAGTGDPSQTTGGWTISGALPCSGPAHLICLERVAGPALPTPPVTQRRAFVTSVSGNADLGSWPAAEPGSSGVAAGDSICRNLAAAAGFTEAATFKVWLSTTAVHAVDRFVHDGPWQAPNAVVVAWGKGDLTDGQLLSSIHVTDLGEYLGNWGVWTGTDDTGQSRPERCADWTTASGAMTGANGAANRTVFGWSWSFGAVGCDSTFLRLYCLSDAAGPWPLFADGFEWATTAAWSAVTP